jgi:putative FmdB family regulatory protein
MPIFEFECQTCGEAFEELLRSSAIIEQITCPECGGAHVRKKMSTFASKVPGKSSFSFNSSASSACSTGST